MTLPQPEAVELLPSEEMTTLYSCPIGLFIFDGELCLKTEYYTESRRVDAYIVSSGEFFAGPAPQTVDSQLAAIVTPVLVRNRRASTLAASAEHTVAAEILDIMRAYDVQVAKNGYPGTPGGLEHMGDVWRLLGRWRRQLEAPPPVADHEAEIAALKAKYPDDRVALASIEYSPTGRMPILYSGHSIRNAIDRAVAIMRRAALPPARTRDELGRSVREAWVRWATTQSNPKPSWLVPYDELSESDKEVDRQIGEAVTWAALPIAEEDQRLLLHLVNRELSEPLPSILAQRLREIAAKLEGK